MIQLHDCSQVRSDDFQYLTLILITFFKFRSGGCNAAPVHHVISPGYFSLHDEPDPMTPGYRFRIDIRENLVKRLRPSATWRISSNSQQVPSCKPELICNICNTSTRADKNCYLIKLPSQPPIHDIELQCGVTVRDESADIFPGNPSRARMISKN
jgi:hypothetical protein